MSASAPAQILALDLGTSGLKAGVFESNGEMVSYSTAPYEASFAKDGAAEQDPSDWWAAILETTQNLGDLSGVRAVGVTGQWSGTVAIDSTRSPIFPAMTWLDSRGEKAIRSRINPGPVSIVGYHPLRLLNWLKVSMGVPGLSGKDPVAHIAYLKDSHPEIFEKATTFLEPIDFIANRLSGKTTSGFDTIAAHWLCDVRRLDQVRYDSRFLKWSQVPMQKLPSLVPANSIVGGILPDVAKALGVPENTQVISPSPDLHTAAVGAGAVDHEEANLYVGTSSWITCHVPKAKPDFKNYLTTLPSAFPDRFLLSNEQESAGDSLLRIQHLLFEEPASFERLESLLAESAPGANGALFFPWWKGERTPVDNNDLRAGWVNLSPNHDKADLVRAVYEGVALNTRWLLSKVESYLGEPVSHLRFIGGGAQSEPWCQIFADVLNREILQIDQPRAANLRGCALLCSLAMGWTSMERLSDCVKIAKTFTPSPDVELYDKGFEHYLKFYKRMRHYYKELTGSSLWKS